MKRTNYFEVIVGTLVILFAGLFLINSIKSAKIQTSKGYEIIAKFDDVGDISSGSDVKISGIKIGTVSQSELDKDTYRATLKIQIQDDVKIPLDSSVKVASSGLLGAKYLEISPGADIEYLSQGDEIAFTQSSVNLEDLLGKFIFGAKDKN